MQEPLDAAHGDEEVPPLNISELRLRLRYVSSNQHVEQEQILREIADLGAASQPLAPLVAERYRAGALNAVPASSLADLFLKTGSAELLNALREKGTLRNLDDFRKCSLLETGISELEAELAESLWKTYETAGNPARVAIANSFGRAGSASALETLEVIRYKMAGRIAEQEVVTRQPPESLPAMTASADEAFLEAVRRAICEIKRVALDRREPSDAGSLPLRIAAFCLPTAAIPPPPLTSDLRPPTSDSPPPPSAVPRF